MLDIATILLDGQNVSLPALREWLDGIVANGEIDVLATGTDGVTAHTYLRPGFTTPMTVGMLGGPEANIGFNFSYNGSTHQLFDTDYNAWSYTCGNAGWTWQFIPAGTNDLVEGLDPWQHRGSQAMYLKSTGDVLLGFGISAVPSAWLQGNAIEMGGKNGSGIWSAGGSTYLISNYKLIAGPLDKFIEDGFAGYFKISGGAIELYASDVSGTAGGTATMVKRFGVSEAGVLTLPAYGTGGVVTVGDADSGGSGYKLLRVPN